MGTILVVFQDINQCMGIMLENGVQMASLVSPDACKGSLSQSNAMHFHSINVTRNSNFSSRYDVYL